jgi:magnesium transporter
MVAHATVEATLRRRYDSRRRATGRESRDTPWVIVGCAIYEDGLRVGAPEDLRELSAACRADGKVVWVGLYEPTAEQFADVAREFDLHPLAVEDTVNAHQRPKLERYGTTLFLVLRPARYIDETETVEFGELHVFVGPQFVITVRHGEASGLHRVREALEGRPDLLKRGPVAIMHAIVDRVVDDYAPVIAGVENDIDEIEDDVFDGGAAAARRIYDLTREVIDFQRATVALPDILRRLIDDVASDDEERRYLRDVEDHALRVHDQTTRFRELLQNILSVNLTLETKTLNETSIAQNEEVKKISAWAAILFAPSVVGTIYGMNFKHMPELKWELGYPWALGLMLLVSVVLFAVFKRRRWI